LSACPYRSSPTTAMAFNVMRAAGAAGVAAPLAFAISTVALVIEVGQKGGPPIAPFLPVKASACPASVMRWCSPCSLSRASRALLRSARKPPILRNDYRRHRGHRHRGWAMLCRRGLYSGDRLWPGQYEGAGSAAAPLNTLRGFVEGLDVAAPSRPSLASYPVPAFPGILWPCVVIITS
jgi:hypothetical protein